MNNKKLTNDLKNSIKTDYEFDLINEHIYFNLIKRIFQSKFIYFNNQDDINTLIYFSMFIMNIITHKLNIDKDDITLLWTDNNIFAILLLLLPYIDSTYYDMIHELNDIINFIGTESLDLGTMTNSKKIFDLLNNTHENIKEINDNEYIYAIIYYNIIYLIETIDIIKSKLYINWTNTIPITIQEYKNISLYSKTIDLFSTFKDKKNIIDFINKNEINNIKFINYSGLWVGDIYNVIRNDLFINIKKIKYFIYSYADNNEKKYFINILNEYYCIEDIINNDLNIVKLKKNINDLISNIEDVDDNIIEVNKYFLVFFISSENIEYDKSNKFKYKIDESNALDKKKNNDVLNKLLNSDLKTLLDFIIKNNTILSKLIKYIYTSVNKLIYSFYGKQLFEKKNDKYKLVNDYYYYDNTHLNLKNIYNISKSLSNVSNDIWESLDINYLSLSYIEKSNFFLKLWSHTEDFKWINLKNNLWLLHKNDSSSKEDFVENKYFQELSILLNDFNQNIIDIVFKTLIYNGVLSEFKVKIEENYKDWENAYYYINNEQYKDVKEKNINFIDNIKELKELKKTRRPWFVLHAMNWISQIDFFKHYLYNRIIYVSGATGSGKTSQVSKLIFYALKAIDYNIEGKLHCTAPKIQVLKGNAETVSRELYFNINDIDKHNTYVQYKYKGGTHSGLNKHYITFITDGILFQNITNNITLFDSFNEEYVNSTKYNVIFIDEAHEHNTNMDLILTLLRDTLYVNNKIKLFIVSATLSEDETIYRQFYLNIKDFLMYPIKCNIKCPFKNVELKDGLKYLDRRYDITPLEQPDINIKEIYSTDKNLDIFLKNTHVNKKEVKPPNELQEICENAQKESYKTIEKLCNSKLKGDILLFLPGQKEILDAVEHFNTSEKINNTIVALPFFKNMDDKYKNIIQDLENNLNKINHNKTDIHKIWTGKYTEGNCKNDFKNAIIISTNIAESSITFTTLYYVVDIGFSKIQYINDFKDLTNSPITINKKTLFNTNLEIYPITNNSSIQRRGRVGRVRSGEVHYIYLKNSRESINPYYSINSDINIFDFILNNILTEDDKKETIIFDKCDPNKFNKLEIIDKTLFVYKSKLLYIYKENFKYNNLKDKSIYVNDMDITIYRKGIDTKNIFDYYGKYYLIHPYERFIGRIRRGFDSVVQYIFSLKKPLTNYMYKDFFVYSTKFGYLNTINDEIIKDRDNKSDFIENNKFQVSEMYKSIIELKRYLPFTHETNEQIYVHTYIYSLILNCHIDVFDILVLLDNNITINNLVTYENFKLLLVNISPETQIKSDIIFLHKLLRLIKKKLFMLKIFNLKNKNIILEIKNKINEIENKNLLACNFNKMINESDILISDEICDIFINDNKKNHYKIINFCKEYNLNEDKILVFLNKIIKMYLKISKFKSQFSEIIKTKYYPINEDRILSHEDKILKCFFYTHQLNIISYTDNKYISTDFINNYEISFDPFTVITKYNSNILFSLSKKQHPNNEVEFIHSMVNIIDIKWVLALLSNTDLQRLKLKNTFNVNRQKSTFILKK